MQKKGKNELVWRLKKGMDRRFKAGHPWVYSNELQESPKGVEPGALVQLQDAGGAFLARGFGNAQSLISFRALSRDPKQLDPMESEAIVHRLLQAHSLRKQLGFHSLSHRLCFGESDALPGLVIDRYFLSSGQVFVFQAHTAGANRMLMQWEEILKSFLAKTEKDPDFARIAVVFRNDLAVRVREGLTEEEPQVVQGIEGVDLSRAEIRVRSVLGAEPLKFQVDLVRGQKTGFFLDQFSNIQIAAQRFQSFEFGSATRDSGPGGAPLQILDLCSYVGQWGAQLAALFQSRGQRVEVTAVDASAKALEFAKKNVEAQGAHFKAHCGNVLKDLAGLPSQSFDLVISDPPALIKSRKDLGAGTRAYRQLAAEVFRLVRPGGGVVCCSCSALLEEEVFIQAQAFGMQKNGVSVRWIARGSQSPDHPLLAEFPEGRYLKAWVGTVIPEKV